MDRLSEWRDADQNGALKVTLIAELRAPG